MLRQEDEIFALNQDFRGSLSIQELEYFVI